MSNQQWGPPPVQPPQYAPQQQSWGAPPGQYAGPPVGQYAAPPAGPGQYSGPPQYQQGFGWGQLPPPPKKKRGGAIVVGILGGLLVLAVAGFVIASTVLKKDEPTVTSPAYTPTTGATQPPPLPTRQTAQPTRQPTRPVPTTRPTTNQPTPNQVLTTNRIYKTGVQRPMGCRESKAGLSTGAKAGQYYRQIKLCLDRAWPRQIVAAGEKWRAPNMIVFAGTANTPCGSTTDGRSFYCQSGHTIYMNSPLHVDFFRTNPTFGRAAATFTVAHEYGHAMQSLLGILSSNAWLQYEANGAKKLELNRRMELQASCLGSVFSGANKGSYGLKGQLYTHYLYILNTSGDENLRNGPRDHGSRANHGYWSKRGFAARNPAFCNTFVAPARQVS
ncbi:neutral zinc metallopeptidase [Kribbella catacumbae]|uniref:neutral zinc metallopeptidase n=1 Tax=Kribbella catacumbae TaxID=460086 RepID=UPI0003A94899|nr:neutral zinc metallopeptidase [Kribbella catacumbae]